MTRPLTAATVVCTASHERKALLHACIRSLLEGTRVPDRIFVVVDQNPSLKAELHRSLPSAVTLVETERPGNSEARNVGIGAATQDVVSFIDDDATVEREWLASLMEAFEGSEDVLGVGGAVVPEWYADRRWLPDELLWVVGCTYRGHRVGAGPIRNPIGCNMAFRRRELTNVGNFSADFGKNGKALSICDETEVSLRLERAYGSDRILYAPRAVVHHVVTPGRVSWKVLVLRCLSEGLSKGRLHRLYRSAAVSRERVYVRDLILRAMPRLLVGGVLRRDRRATLGAASILVSLTISSLAFVAGLAMTSGADAGGSRARS